MYVWAMCMKEINNEGALENDAINTRSIFCKKVQSSPFWKCEVTAHLYGEPIKVNLDKINGISLGIADLQGADINDKTIQISLRRFRHCKVDNGRNIQCSGLPL